MKKINLFQQFQYLMWENETRLPVIFSTLKKNFVLNFYFSQL